MHRLVIAAPHGRSGKTTVTIGVVAALAARGLAVQAFKRGPDYIDPGWLTEASGRACRNLDRYFCTEEQVLASFRRGCTGADVAIIEGAMGLFDGLDLEGSGSTAEVARVLGAPVVLVVDATRMTRSVAALVRGFMEFDNQIRVAGVILNRVSGPRHREMMTAAIAKYCGIPVLGCLPKSRELAIPDRHLGLVPAVEEGRQAQILAVARRLAEEHLDLDGLLALAASVPALERAVSPATVAPLPAPAPSVAAVPLPAPVARIGYFKDECFTFYYPENLEALQENGAELIPINALLEEWLPDIDALYLGGGFPEEFAPALQNNEGLRAAVRAAVEADLPVYAECGGLMYLCRTIQYRGTAYAMSGALPADVLMEEKPQGHGYTLMEATAAHPLFAAGSLIKGHEFHNSRLADVDVSRIDFAYIVRKGTGIDREHDGLVYRNVVAGYNHLHALGAPDWAPALVAKAVAYRQRSLSRG